VKDLRARIRPVSSLSELIVFRSELWIAQPESYPGITREIKLNIRRLGEPSLHTFDLRLLCTINGVAARSTLPD
jgi:hypothetical protein